MLTEQAELRQRGARAPELGPERGRRQAGQVRRRRCSPRTASSRCPPTRWRTWSTRPARATRSPAASSATSPPTRGEDVDHEALVRAMAYGTALASFNVEEFGTERMVGLKPGEVAGRVADLQRMTTFEHQPIPLRG